MATWTRTETDDHILIERADGEAGFKVRKNCPHLHAEQWIPWGEDWRSAPADLADYWQQTLEANGETVT